jgi:hypothetical protein
MKTSISQAVANLLHINKPTIFFEWEEGAGPGKKGGVGSNPIQGRFYRH